MQKMVPSIMAAINVRETKFTAVLHTGRECESKKFTYGQAVEQVRKSLPQFDRVAALALVVKAVNPAAK
jgi:hypothetical protein